MGIPDHPESLDQNSLSYRHFRRKLGKHKLPGTLASSTFFVPEGV